MSKRYILVLVIVLALTLSACTRSASTAPESTATPLADFPKPVATTGMNAIEIAGTQTAVATAGLPEPTAAGGETGNPTPTTLPGLDETPVVVQPTTNPADVTPLPSPTVGVAATAVPATAAPQVTAAPIVKPATYVLQEGEFPYCLARRFNVNPDELISLNGLSSGQILSPGLSLKIPQSAGSFPGSRALRAHPTTYTVTSGETIYSVACKFGDVDPLAIASLNGLTGNYALNTGTTIKIP